MNTHLAPALEHSIPIPPPSDIALAMLRCVGWLVGWLVGCGVDGVMIERMTARWSDDRVKCAIAILALPLLDMYACVLVVALWAVLFKTIAPFVLRIDLIW